MRSRITIELDFDNNNEPYIQIHQLNSDDMRDKVLKSFLEKLGGESQWLKIRCEPQHPSVLSSEIGPKWKITAIRPSELENEFAMDEWVKAGKKYGYDHEKQNPVFPQKQDQGPNPMTIRCGPPEENHFPEKGW